MSAVFCCNPNCHNTVGQDGIHILREVNKKTPVRKQDYRGESYCSRVCLHITTHIDEGTLR